MSGEEAAVLLKGGTIVDPPPVLQSDRGSDGGEAGFVEDADLLIRRGRVVERGKGLAARGARVLDVSGMLVFPGFVDIHAHVREPGAEYSEDLKSLTEAAVLGGYVGVVLMPNTDPPIDSVEAFRAMQARADAVGVCHVYWAACVTRGRAGHGLTPMASLAREGVRLFTDDGAFVWDSRVMRDALLWAKRLAVVVADHAEDPWLCGEWPRAWGGEVLTSAGGLSNRGIEGAPWAGGGSRAGRSSVASPYPRSEAAPGSANESGYTASLGLAGRPREAEKIAVERDIVLCEATGARLHVMHVSAKESVEAIHRAKEQGVPLTAEVTPHHLALTERALKNFDPVYRVNPPLRTEADRQALLEAVCEGTIDAVATDHAPHAQHLKELPFEKAPPGIAGLEVAAALCYELLVEAGLVELPRFAELFSSGPARVAGLIGNKGLGRRLEPGVEANVTVFDPSSSWVYEPSRSATKAKLTPWNGRKFCGRVVHTFVGGRHVVERSKLRLEGVEAS